MRSLLPPFLTALALMTAGHRAAAQQMAVDPGSVQQRPEPHPAPPTQIAVDHPCRPEFGCSAQIALGLEAHTVHIGSPALASDYGVIAFGERANLIMTQDHVATDVVYDVGIGGGTSGLDLRGGLQFGFGSRIDFDPWQGLYARGGARLLGMKNNHLGFGIVELPKLDIGYQRLRGSTVTEIGGELALAMGSEFAVGEAVPWGPKPKDNPETPDFARNKSGWRPSWGGHLTLVADPLSLRMQFTRIEAGSDGPGPVDLVQSLLCGQSGVITFCTDTRAVRGNVIWSQPDGDRTVNAHAWMVGIVVGASPVPMQY